MPVSVAVGMPDKMVVRGSNLSQEGRLLMGLTLAERVIGWLSGSMKRVLESLTAKGMP